MASAPITIFLRPENARRPSGFATRDVPRKPKDLNDHRCISLRLPGGPYRWEFEKGRKTVTIGVNGPLVIDDTNLVIQAALAGAGLGLAFEEQVAEYLAKRRLVRVLEDWTPPIPGFYMYYPSRRHQPAALAALTNALRSFKTIVVARPSLRGAQRRRRSSLSLPDRRAYGARRTQLRFLQRSLSSGRARGRQLQPHLHAAHAFVIKFLLFIN